MRTKSAFINSMSGMIYQVVNMILGMLVPRYIIMVYGSEINGLTSNIHQYINILNLLQAGLIAASGYEMYKPIANGDNKTVGRIYYSDRDYFKKMSCVYFALAVIVMPIMLVGKVEMINITELIGSILIMALNGYLTFKYACCYDLMFAVYQKKYILFISLFLERFIYYIVLFFCLLFRCNYNWMYVGYLLGTIVKLLFLRYKFKRMYEKSIIQYKNQTGYKIRNQYYVLSEQIVFRIIDSMPILIVTKMYSLNHASIYSVYLMIISAFKSLFDTIQNAITPSFGDLYARNEKEKAHVSDVFEMIQGVYFIILNVISICLSVLFVAFIDIYMAKSQTLNYVYNGIALFISLHMILYIYFTLYNMVTNAVGLYKDFFKGNIVIGLLALVVSIICAGFDFQLVYIGIIVYYLFAMAQRFGVIRKKVLNLSFKCIVRPLVSILLYVICYYVFADKMLAAINGNLVKWLVAASVSGIIGTIVSIIISIFIDKKQCVAVLKGISSILKRKSINFSIKD